MVLQPIQWTKFYKVLQAQEILSPAASTSSAKMSVSRNPKLLITDRKRRPLCGRLFDLHLFNIFFHQLFKFLFTQFVADRDGHEERITQKPAGHYIRKEMFSSGHTRQPEKNHAGHRD